MNQEQLSILISTTHFAAKATFKIVGKQTNFSSFKKVISSINADTTTDKVS